MILLDSKDIPDAQTTATTSAVVSDDPPPAYVDYASPIASGSGSRASARTADVNQTGARPTNFLSHIRNNGPINGSYTIDPRVRVPPALLPEASEPRRNLYLETKNAPIDVDIFVLGDATSKVDIQLEANGPITARIHATSEGPRPFIHITARSDRPVTITVPRDFRGPLSISTPHSARLPADVTIFTEVQDTRHGFVGDFCDWTEESVGDSLALTSAGGTVTVQCEGEGAGAHSPQTWNPFAWAQMGAARRQAFHAHGALPRMASPSHSLPRAGFTALGSLPHWPYGPTHSLPAWTGFGLPSFPPRVPGLWPGGFPGTNPVEANGSQSARTPGPSSYPAHLYGFPGSPSLDMNGSQTARTHGPPPHPLSRDAGEFPSGFGFHPGLHSGHDPRIVQSGLPNQGLNAVAHDNDLDTLRPLRGPIAGSRDDGDLDNLRPLRDLTAGTRDGDYPVIRRVPSLHNLNPRTPDDGLDMLRSLHNLSLGSSDRDLGHPDDAHHVGDVLERTPSLGLRPRRLRSRSRHSLSRGSRAPRPLAT